jgi:antitoxin (DNA-binding transcriptional repressor) of toxin-antitoxin stability system
MRKASVGDLCDSFKKIDRLLNQGEESEITSRRRTIARLVRAGTNHRGAQPDFLAPGALHLPRAIYVNKVLRESGAEIVAQDRDRY